MRHVGAMLFFSFFTWEKVLFTLIGLFESKCSFFRNHLFPLYYEINMVFQCIELTIITFVLLLFKAVMLILLIW